MSSPDQKGARSAAEVLADLQQKPEHRQRQRELAVSRAENVRRYAEAATGLLGDLRAVGFDVNTVAQLRPGGRQTRPALPALLRWLPLVDYPPLKRDIVATLGRPWARPEAAPALIAEFRRIDPTDDPNEIGWAICDALEHVSDDAVADDLVDIATTKRHGAKRALAALALGRMRKRRADVIPHLVHLLMDEEVAESAIKALRRLGAAEARAAIEAVVEHPQKRISQEARRALTQLPGS